MNNWLIVLQMALPFLCLFLLSEWLYRKLNVPAETTRKLVHVGTGLLTLLFPVVFNHLWQVILICTMFLVILLISLRFHFLPSINAVKRKTLGSVLFPVIVIVVYTFYQLMQQKKITFYPYLYFYLPVLVMAIADPVAAFAGNYYKQSHPAVSGKTVVGSIAFFITAFLLSILLMYVFEKAFFSLTILYSLCVAIVTTIAERISSKGWDNFTIPLSAMVILYLIA